MGYDSTGIGARSSAQMAALDAPIVGQGGLIAQPPPVYSEPGTADTPTSEPTAPELAAAVEDPAPSRPPRLRLILIAADLSVAAVALVTAIGWVFAIDGRRLIGPGFVAHIAALLVAVVGLLFAAGLYRRRLCEVRASEVARSAWVAGAVGVGSGLVLWLSMPGGLALVGAGLAAALLFVGLFIERGLFREWVHANRSSGRFSTRVIVVGGEIGSVDRLSGFLREHTLFGLDPVGTQTLRLDREPPSDARVSRAEEVGADLAAAGASSVVLDAGSLTGNELSELSDALTRAGIHIHISSGLRGVDRRRINIEQLADETFLHLTPTDFTRRQRVFKRLLDVVVAGTALLLVAPVLAVVALLIKLHDGGPVLFRQERVGFRGEHFHVLKLRTMVTDAEKLKAGLEAQNARSGPLFKLERDPRVTPIGRFLRASSLDELPQLLNVLEGTMSIVGPRPALPAEVAEFDDDLNTRVNVKPGITGLWQVEARDLASFELYRRFDLHYVRNWSIALDLEIIARTAAVVGLRGVRMLVPARLRRQELATGLE